MKELEANPNLSHSHHIIAGRKMKLNSPGDGYSSFANRFVSLPNPIQLRLRSHNQAVARQGRCGQGHLAQAVLAEQLELRPGPDDVGVAVFTQDKELIRGGPGRGSIGIGARPNALALVNLLTGTGVVTIKRAHILENVQAISVHDKARVVRSRRLLPPGDVLIAG